MTQTNSSGTDVLDYQISLIPTNTRKGLPLHFLWVVDASTSLAGDMINALNTAIRDAVPEVLAAAKENPEVQLKIGAIAFSSRAKWLTNGFTPIPKF